MGDCHSHVDEHANIFSRHSTSRLRDVNDGLNRATADIVPHNCVPRCKEGFENTIHCADECVERDLFQTQRLHTTVDNDSKFRLLHDEVLPEEWGTSDWKYQSGQPTTKSGHSTRKDKDVSVHSSSKIREVYEFDDEKTLGAGSYGVVVKALCKEEEQYHAVKMIPKIDKKQVSWAEEEIEMLQQTDHPNIISLVQHLADDANIYLVMQLCEGGALGDFLNDGSHFTELQSLVVSKQILLAVKYLHDILICHRDLKPDNFLLETKSPLETGMVKLIDFGMSCQFRPGVFMTRNVGTPLFVAPEVLKSRYNEKCDLWSVGVMLFVFLCGSYPFFGETMEELWQRIKSGNYHMGGGSWDKVTDGSKALVRGLLKHSYDQRLSADGALSSHAIIKRTPAVQWV